MVKTIISTIKYKYIMQPSWALMDALEYASEAFYFGRSTYKLFRP